ncbi:MAG: transglycosylase domain-containing protein [Christensenellales bacterium]
MSGFVGNERVTLNTLPAYVPNAFIAVEDKRFYSHKGVDPYRMAGAALRNLAAGSFKEGASTITQQLVKNTHLKNEKTLSRKIQEIRIARDLERRESKEKIMETYLGVLYFGNNAYGIDGAARLYFGKSAKKLTLAESATLAGVINSPAVYDPFENPGKCVERRNLVLKKMFENGFISKNEYETAKSAQLVTNGVERAQNQFVNACINEACTKTGLGKDELLNKNVVIRTAYDEKLQNKVTDIIDRYSASAKGEISVVVLDKNCKFVSYASTAKATFRLSSVNPHPL